MNLLLKICGISILTAAVSLMIKNKNPELSFGLTLCTMTVVLAGALRLADTAGQLITYLKNNTAIDPVYLSVILKCSAVGIIVRLCSSLCSDSSHGGLAYALEVSGTAAAISLSVPLIKSFVATICSLV